MRGLDSGFHRSGLNRESPNILTDPDWEKEVNLYAVIPLIEVAFCIALLILLIVLGRRHIARKPFGLFLIFMAFWGIFIFLMRNSTDLFQAALWEKFVFIAIVSVAITFYWFTCTLTGARPGKKIVYPLITAIIVVIGLGPHQFDYPWCAIHVVRESPGYRAAFPALCDLHLPSDHTRHGGLDKKFPELQKQR